jgi:hypothetical protein
MLDVWQYALLTGVLLEESSVRNEGRSKSRTLAPQHAAWQGMRSAIFQQKERVHKRELRGLWSNHNKVFYVLTSRSTWRHQIHEYGAAISSALALLMATSSGTTAEIVN